MKWIKLKTNKYTRWTLLKLPWGSVYLNKIHSSDSEFHTHQWDFISIILKGKVRELNLDSSKKFRFDIRMRKFLHIRRHKATTYHYLKLSKPVYSLCICGKVYNTPLNYNPTNSK